MEQYEYQKKIRAFYEPLLAAHGDETAAVGYPEAAGQRGRYVMLCEVGYLTAASLTSGVSFSPVA